MADNNELMNLINMMAQRLMGNYQQAPNEQGYQNNLINAQMDAIRRAKEQAMSDKLAELGMRGMTGASGAALQATADVDRYYADLQQQAIYDAVAKAADLESTNRQQDMGYALNLAELSMQDKYNLANEAYNQSMLDLQRKQYKDSKSASTWEGVGAIANLLGIGQGGGKKIVSGGVDLFKKLFPGKTTSPTTITPQKLANPLGSNAAIISPSVKKLAAYSPGPLSSAKSSAPISLAKTKVTKSRNWFS